uniref:Mitochondrial fission factor n=1 Tax=Strongyloides papillosus TaxID=174720 RepID=A0A0N5CGA7_STREA
MPPSKNYHINLYPHSLERDFYYNLLDFEEGLLSINNNSLVLAGTMQIPDHISGTGHAKLLEPNLHDYNGRSMTSSMMRVPERIIFGKDGALYGFTEPPIDGISYDEYEYENNRIQLQELPSKLTANEYIETDSVEGAMENHSLTSIAVEENAIKELKMLKRQLARLAIRVYEIEDELEKRKSRDWQSLAMCSFVGIALVIAFNIFSNRNTRIF